MHVTVTFKCGHTETVRLYGNPMEQLAQQRAMETKCVCMDCALEPFGGLKTYEYRELVELQRENGLPRMKGSYKQVMWSMQMRQQMLDLTYGAIERLFNLEVQVLGALPNYRRAIEKNIMGKQDFQERLCEAWGDMINEKADSTWWIANRFNFGYGLCNAILRSWCGLEVVVTRPKHEEVTEQYEYEPEEEEDEDEEEEEEKMDQWDAMDTGQEHDYDDDYDDRYRKHSDDGLDEDEEEQRGNVVPWTHPFMDIAEETEDYRDLERAMDLSVRGKDANGCGCV